MDLHDTQGQRLYLTADERAAFLAAAKNAALPVRTFCCGLRSRSLSTHSLLGPLTCPKQLASSRGAFQPSGHKIRIIFRQPQVRTIVPGVYR